MQDFRKLKVWEKSHRLMLSVYALTATFPPGEQYGLTAQMRRCSSSIPSNIAEGCGRGSRADLSRFLHIAMGSANEYQLLAARDLGYATPDDYASHSADLSEVERMLSALIATMSREA